MPDCIVCRTFPAQTAQLASCFDFVHAGANAAKLDGEDINKLDLVLEELFTNLARYAYEQPDSGDVEVAYKVEAPGRMLVQISDSGRDFNPLASDPPDFSRGLADRPVGGLGIFLVKSIAESISYERNAGRNTISFRFCGSGRHVNDSP
ncbi:MAG: ATP-binding protein [Acidobacteriaceae bacterium]|nr:ATP-binding protein [Acidobacteriaceae bacterium]